MTNQGQEKSKYKALTAEEERVIVHKGTERPFTGIYNDFNEEGQFTCKRCGEPLYNSSDKFDGHCGWPSFDDEIPGAVKRILDADGRRTEIVCANCGAHLGHVFEGENFTEKNIRHCVNSISLSFEAVKLPAENYDTAYFASGCFWGTQYHFQKQAGVISTEVGYMGGHRDNPSYEQVCTGQTGHAETTKVVFDPSKTSYEKLTQLFSKRTIKVRLTDKVLILEHNTVLLFSTLQKARKKRPKSLSNSFKIKDMKSPQN